MTDKLARADSAYSLAREAGDETIVVGLDFALALVNIAKAAQGVSIRFAHLQPSGDNETGSPLALLRAALAVLDGDQ